MCSHGGQQGVVYPLNTTNLGHTWPPICYEHIYIMPLFKYMSFSPSYSWASS